MYLNMAIVSKDFYMLSFEMRCVLVLDFLNVNGIRACRVDLWCIRAIVSKVAIKKETCAFLVLVGRELC